MTKELEITLRQREIYCRLKNHEVTKQFCVDEWYLGALHALDNPRNPDRFSQAAHSLRELIMKLKLQSKLGTCYGVLSKIAHYELLLGKEKQFKDNMEKLEEYLIENLQNEKIENNFDNQKFITKSYSTNLELTSQQEDLYNFLKDYVDTKEFCFSDFYLGALYALDNCRNPDRFSQAASSLRELVEIHRSYETGIDKRRKVRKPEAAKKLHERNDPNIRVLSPDIQKSIQKEAEDLRKELQDITHHEPIPPQCEFNRYITKLEEIFRQLKPDIIKDRKELKNLLNQSEINNADKEKILQLLKRGSNFIFFFETIDNDETWLSFLVIHKNVFFYKVPDDIRNWFPILYLEKISEKKPKEVVEIILGFQETNNLLVLETIFQIALKTPLEESIKLKDWVFNYLKLPIIYPDIVNKLIEYWSKEDIGGINTGMELIKEIVFFEGPTKSTEPHPKLRDWEYCEILRHGVSSVSKNKPIEVARILIEATNNMLDMESGKSDCRDTSGSWCKYLDKIEEKCKTSRDPMCKLIQTLTFACEQVYGKKRPSEIEELDQLLTEQKWFVFRRIQYHLYSSNLNEQTKPKIRELILGYDYGREDGYGYEFQRMVCRACEHFGEQLLAKNERQKIFDTIMNGPSKERFRKFLEFHGQVFTESYFNKRKRHWHRKSLRPFKTVLFGKYEKYYEELDASDTKKISDEDYRNKSGVYKTISKSPISKEKLKQFSDQELLEYINSYQENEFILEKEICIETGVRGLTIEFGNLFEESIITDSSRINFWLENLEKIKYPTYISVILEKISADVRGGNFEKLNIWFEFCKKILSKSPKELTMDYYGSVVNFISACLSSDKQLPATEENYKSLSSLLSTLCTEAGFKMSKDVPWTLTKEGNFEKDWRNAHGCARCRAFKILIEFGRWILQHNIVTDIKAITTILEECFNKHFLTLPEKKTLAREYPSIYGLDPKWAKEHKSKFFPQDDLKSFKKIFSQFLDADQICFQTFEIVYDELVYSIQNLTEFKYVKDPFEHLIIGGDDTGFVKSLEEYLLCCYIYGAYPLKGDDSLLQEYYQQIQKIPKRQGPIFHTMGHLANDDTSDADQEIIRRFKDYFDWRFQETDKKLKEKELEQFVSWLQADCLDAEWRLDNYYKILDLNIIPKKNICGQLIKLNDLHKQNTDKVIECFEKLVKSIKGKTEPEYHMNEKEIKPILETGLESKNKTTRERAQKICRNLLEIKEHSSWVSELVEKYNIN